MFSSDISYNDDHNHNNYDNLKLNLMFSHTHKYTYTYTITGGCGSTVVKVLCYKLEGHWFDSRCCHWNFSMS